MQIQCPQCNTKLSVPDTLVGKRVACGKCKTPFLAEEIVETALITEPEPAIIDAVIVPEPQKPTRKKAREIEEEEAAPQELFDFGGPASLQNPDDRPKPRPVASSPDVDPFASEDLDMDELEGSSTHTLQPMQFVNRQQMNLVGLFGGIGLAVVFALIFGIGIYRRGLEPFGSGIYAGGAFIVLGIVIAIASLCALIYRYVKMPRSITVDSFGLSWTTMNAVGEVAWEDVKHVLRSEKAVVGGGKVNNWESNLIIEYGVGQKLHLDHSLSDYKAMAAKIQYLSAKQLLPRKSAELADGETEFGPIVMEPGQVRIRKVAIAWDNLTEWGLWNGHAIFLVKKKRHSIPLAEVPDYRVFLALMISTSGKAPSASKAIQEQ